MASTNPPQIRAFLYHVLTNLIVAEVPFTSMSFSQTLNQSGSFSGTLPINDPRVDLFFGDSSQETKPNLMPVRMGILVEKGGELIWEGIIWTVEVSTSQQSVRVGAEGCWSLFRQRLITEDFALFDANAQSYNIAVLLLAGHMSGTPRTVSNIYLRAEVTGTDGLPLVDGYEVFGYEYRSVGSEIEQLASGWSTGFDFLVRPEWCDEDDPRHLGAGEFIKTFYIGGIHFDYLGTIPFGMLTLGTHFKDFTFNVDGKSMATHAYVLGEGEGYNMMTASAQSPAWMYFFPQERTVARKQIWKQNQLADLAESEANKTRYPVCVPRLQLVPGAEIPQKTGTSLGMAWRYETIYTPGDTVQIAARYGNIDITTFSPEGLFRVLGWTINCNDSGDYTTDLEVVPASAFNL